jgi:hypothetical protein
MESGHRCVHSGRSYLSQYVGRAGVGRVIAGWDDLELAHGLDTDNGP